MTAVALEQEGRRTLPASLPAFPALFAYLVLATSLFSSAWRSPAVRNIGGFRDPPMLMWFLHWTPWALAEGRNPFVTDYIGFPPGVNLMWNTTMFLPGLVLAPVTAVFGAVVTYNAFVTANVVLSAWCAFLAFRCFVVRPWAAFVGGLVYGFSPYMLAQSAEHPNLTAAYLPPLLMVLLAEILVRQRHPPWRGGTALGLLAVLQLFVTEELLASQALAAALGVALLALLHRDQVAAKARNAGKAFAVAAGAFSVIAAWPLTIQFFGPQRYRGPAQRPGVFVTDLANLVVPTQFQQLAPGFAVARSHWWTGNPLEWNGYLGIPLLVLLVVVAIRLWARPLVRLASLLAVALVVLSLGATLHVNGHDTGVPLPWRLFHWLPLAEHLLPNRLMLYVDLMAALMVALWVDHLGDRRTEARSSSRWKPAIGALVVGAALVPLVPALPYPSSPRRVPAFFTSEAVRRIPEGSVALIAPWHQVYPADPMLWQAASGLRFRMAQGTFLGPDADGERMYGAPLSTLSLTMLQVQQSGGAPELTDELRSRLATDLSERQVETIVIGPMRHRDAMIRLFSELLGRQPEQRGGVAVWWELALGIADQGGRSGEAVRSPVAPDSVVGRTQQTERAFAL